MCGPPADAGLPYADEGRGTTGDEGDGDGDVGAAAAVTPLLAAFLAESRAASGAAFIDCVDAACGAAADADADAAPAPAPNAAADTAGTARAGSGGALASSGAAPAGCPAPWALPHQGQKCTRLGISLPQGAAMQR